ncbi:hydroxyethylthiazole kinase [Tamlana sedimentorum]|uniref:Hydroxyethylthiazole kinase n=1 Tax=Neotamlana sedimentorum TaxID=1435349 RepID=A0A0D7WDX5_9FLAO|nr:hydroxyethylthiazole kinase [Tamlana sedimentorum]KJD35947.1 hydroxyethylthiazole kinase [Tamlana sedimentorum]
MSKTNAFKNILNSIKNTSPLVHNITNYVVMNNTANALLAVGASPVMAHAIEEVEDIVSISSSLVINMGTLSEKWIDAMLLAAKKAKTLNKPFVFDPVGVGASKYRSETAQRIINEATPDIIRGNASEIMALAQLTNSTKGVDSTVSSDTAVVAAEKLSKELNNTIVISGATDYIVTGNTIDEVTDGSALMPKVTGMGCTATSIIGACIAVEPNYHVAATVGMQIMGKAGNLAEKSAEGPGSFQIHFLDVLHQLK